VKLTPEERLARHKESDRKWYQSHIEEHKERCRLWKVENHEKLGTYNSRWNKANPEKCEEAARKWGASHPAERKAERLARRKIPLSATCELCGARAQHRHHPDYSKPLLVMHVCANCHKGIHEERRRICPES